MLDVPAALLYEVEARDSEVGGSIGEVLRDICSAHEDRLEVIAQGRHERPVYPERGFEASLLEELKRALGEAPFVRQRDADALICLS